MNNKGVSLVSLVITIVVIIILAAVSILNSTKSLEEANKVKFQNDLKTVVEALNVYNERSVIRGIPSYDKEKLEWDGESEKAENTAKIKDTNHVEEDSIRDIFDGNDVPNSLKGLIKIEYGKIKVDSSRHPEYEWAKEMYSDI
ncbi:MAG: hypothetical protein J6C46_02585 [Clostridia bacterium]|nr:hypothetical protein [Clostridia bacterium]